MRLYTCPYYMGVFIAQHLDSRCRLCQSRASSPDPHTGALITVNKKWFDKVWLTHWYADKGILCNHCHQAIPWLPEPFSRPLTEQQVLTIQHATYYTHPVNQLILRFKSGDMSVLPILVHIIRQLPIPSACDANNSVIVPVPTTHDRLINRGFNPVAILTQYLSAHWQIPIWQGIQRVDNTVSQKGLNRSQRMSNIKGAFSVNAPTPPKTLLLFDDVSTTGSTLVELAQTLSNAYISSSKIPPLKAYCLAHGRPV